MSSDEGDWFEESPTEGQNETHQSGTSSASSASTSCAGPPTAKPRKTVGIIYKLTSPSGKSYVGQTVQSLEARLGNHRCRSRCYAIGAAIKKYGIKAFVVETLATNVPIDQIDDVEDEMIVKHGTLKPGGYNLVRGRPETGKAARYQRFSETAKEFANTESFKDKKRALWQDPEWAAAWRSTWMDKRQDVLEGLEGRERDRKLLDHKRNDRIVRKRKAMKDPESKKAWEEEYSDKNVMLRRRQRFHNARVEKMKAMNTVDGLDYIRRLTETAVKGSRRSASKTSPEDVHKWFPNVLTTAEIQALRNNGGVWPSTP